jgi:hypothetical protein
LRLGRLPGLSASKTSESVSTISIGLYVSLLACLFFFRLLYAGSEIPFMTVGRPGICGASRRSAIAEVEGLARVS